MSSHWRWVLGWLIFITYFALVAHSSHQRDLHLLAQAATVALAPYAERGVESSRGGYPHNDYLWHWQGPMVYLIEHGHREPEMLRAILLCEVRRSYDRIYLYDRCLNWDLRKHLIAECVRAFPDDPALQWAVGRCLLTAGEYEAAADHLLKAEELGFDADQAGVVPEHFVGRIEAALLMSGRNDELIVRCRGLSDAELWNGDAHYAYAELLTKLERYADSDQAVSAWREALGDDLRQYALELRNAWWSRDLEEFNHRALSVAEHVEDLTLLAWAGVRVALLRGDCELAEILAGDRRELYLRALAEAYAFTGDGVLLERIRAELESSSERYALIESGYQHWEERQAAGLQMGIAEVSLLRAHLLREEWPEVVAVIRNREWTDSRPRLQHAYEVAQLMAKLAQHYDSEKPWRWFRWRSQLPFLLDSQLFADAAVSGGYDPLTARGVVLADLVVDRGTYHDSSNGTLDW